MKKIFKGLICAGLCGVLALGATGCSPSEHRDPEKTPLRLAIGAVDQKFNPLFYTSQNDGEIANLTQASLVTADSKGVIAYGDKYPTVALDYLETYYNEGGEQIGTGNGISVQGKSDASGSTAYEFLIKNDMKFSSGEDLTVMDVLFNLYVYLDPVYSGSSTIYSTKIKGLQRYRQQADVADDGADTSSTLKYYPAALNRLNELISWADKGGATPDESLLSTQAKSDLVKVKELYLEELTTDWSSIETGWVESYKNYRFTEAWQVFYYIEGIVHNQTERDVSSLAEVELTDHDGKYLTTLDPVWDPSTNDFKVDEDGNVYQPEHQEFITDMNNAVTPAKIAEYKAKYEGMSDEDAKLALQKEHAINHVYEANSVNSQIDYILTYCATRSTALDYFIKDEMSKDKNEGALDYPSITGITVSHTADAEHNGTFNGKTYSDDHDILRIEINGIDPKAKWNFAFAVAPMYYYSDTAHYSAAMAAYTNGSVYAGTCTDFGVEYKDINWFNDVLAAKEKNGVPVGAGPYKCCTYKYNSENLDANSFFYSNMAYFERNEYFTTMGAEVKNANIKYVTYKVYSDDKIVEALKTKEIDYGTPVATSDNQRELNTGTMEQITYLTGGYGYVGINPKYVPDIEVRQAIMHAFDTSSIIEYYGDSLVNLINRPMSTTSWAYPDGATRYYERWTDPQQFIQLVESSGNWYYNESDRKLHSNDSSNSVLKLTFTIAGDTTDHPSYSMFTDAKVFLEQCGFEISVETNISALKLLSTGDLAVWAAAWSSSIDPDPYQVYSINSNATSTKNWNKDGILLDQVTYATEYEIAQKLNQKIIEGRQTLNQRDREIIYGETIGTDKCALDLIMDLAVEFPTYQRYDLCVYNSAVLDASTMTKDPSFNMGPIDELWKLNYKK